MEARKIILPVLLMATQVPAPAWAFELQEAGPSKSGIHFKQGSKESGEHLQRGFTAGGRDGSASIGYQVETKKDVFWDVRMNFHPSVDRHSGRDDHSVRVGTSWRF